MPEPPFDSAALASLLIEVLPAIERDRLAPVLDDLWACGFTWSHADADPVQGPALAECFRDGLNLDGVWRMG